MEGCPVYTLILPFKPSRKGTPYVINTGDGSGTEKVFLDETHGVLYGTFAFRISLIADPELQLLFCAEVLEGSGLDDLPVGLCRNEHGILIDDQHRRAAAELAEGPVKQAFRKRMLSNGEGDEDLLCRHCHESKPLSAYKMETIKDNVKGTLRKIIKGK